MGLQLARSFSVITDLIESWILTRMRLSMAFNYILKKSLVRRLIA